jgi:hypothetical protein
VFTVDPKFCGISQGALILARCETQMSKAFAEPPRPKYRVNPSLEINGASSAMVVFTGGPTFAGGDQSVNWGYAVAGRATARTRAILSFIEPP